MVAGLTQFIQRLESGFSPLGEALAQEFAREGSVTALLAFAFCFGFGATVAEPALLEEYRANTPVITFRHSMTLHVGDYTFELMRSQATPFIKRRSPLRNKRWSSRPTTSSNSGGAAMGSRVSESAVADSPASGCAGIAGQ